MTAVSGILDDLRESFGTRVLTDVEFPTIVPDSVETVSQVVSWCREHAWRILIAGRGHTFSEHHHVPTGVLTMLSSARNGISDASPADLVIDAEAGVPAAAMQQVAERAGLKLENWPEEYPGTVAGLLCGDRGQEFRGMVLGAVIVDGLGVIHHLGGAVRKDVSGFDAAGVLLGSHGSFAWLDRVTLRLKPASAEYVERSTMPPGIKSGVFAGIARQIASAFDPDDVFFKPKG